MDVSMTARVWAPATVYITAFATEKPEFLASLLRFLGQAQLSLAWPSSFVARFFVRQLPHAICILMIPVAFLVSAMERKRPSSS